MNITLSPHFFVLDSQNNSFKLPPQPFSRRKCKIPQVKLHVKKENLGNVIAFDITGFDHRLVAEILASEHGIGVRAGSFCTYELMRKLKGILKEQDKQIAKEVDEGITKNIPGLVRASFALSNTPEDVEKLVEAIKEITLRGANFYKNIYNQDSKTGVWERRSSTNVKPNELNYDSYSMEKYDQDIKRSIPGHDELHNKIASFLKEDLKNKSNLRVLELGVGTGLTADLILKNVDASSFIGLDFSENMLNGAAKRLSNFPVTLIKGDFANTELPKNNDLIVSVIGIHHQETDEDKKFLFKKIYSALSNDGVFIFGDLVTYKEKEKEKAALNDALHFNYLVENAIDEQSLKEWAYHHKYLNKLAPLEDQIAWLKEIGFSEVKVAFNKFNTALILAKRSGEVKNEF
jgi:ubiquinone/menaquinone biosynthesis C-methylase UbiE